MLKRKFRVSDIDESRIIKLKVPEWFSYSYKLNKLTHF